MRHMGNSGRMAIGAFLAAVALLVLTGATLHEAVLMWFLAASAAAYVACVAEVVIRRRHKTLAASGIGSILFLAFGIAFLRQWGLAFNPDPGAMSAPVNMSHPDLYFYLAAGSGAATLLLLFAGTVLPGRRGRARAYASRRPASAPRSGARGASSRGTSSRGTSSRGTVARGAARGTTAPPAPRGPAARTAVPRTATPRPAAKVPAIKSPPAKSPAPSPTRPSARTSARR
ncbi:hypothetical protein QFZ79_000515 [Arthrobacter sp. V4I6]|uniref:hypothetical protein n=1 Tax=unclassified Arthrobacter TaxID=235627 RepID=UPI00278423E6|nr:MULTISPECIES: hypothetical protein [unclassified Arthrobacter]MDQ0822775.1 hypothetical protein [Arthrobacter sp. V1I7]MDQ0852404.1 hypothetical protein [Arthrobacter sp. V4I6]